MASKFDESEFIDTDYESSKQSLGVGTVTTTTMSSSQPQSGLPRPPSREEIEAKVSDAHARLAELKRAQEQLERERSALEEARRRRSEFNTGREEMMNHLTRGVQLIEEAEFAARRDASQMERTLNDLRQALAKVDALREEAWTQENWNTELTRALTTLENARMEWNSARLNWPMLDGAGGTGGIRGTHEQQAAAPKSFFSELESKSFLELCHIGLALSWPVALAGLLGATVITVILLRK
jgi:DNA repair exonuclease SbcCD ATPase subunit